MMRRSASRFDSKLQPEPGSSRDGIFGSVMPVTAILYPFRTRSTHAPGRKPSRANSAPSVAPRNSRAADTSGSGPELEVVVAGNPYVVSEFVQEGDHDPAAAQPGEQGSLQRVAAVDADCGRILPQQRRERGELLRPAVEVGRAENFDFSARAGEEQERGEGGKERFHGAMVPKIRSPASPSPGTIYLFSSSRSSRLPV